MVLNSVERRRRFQPNHQQHQQQRGWSVHANGWLACQKVPLVYFDCVVVCIAGERGREEFSSERGSVLRVKRKCDDDPIQALGTIHPTSEQLAFRLC
jgi:hypothetical protein